MTEKISLQQAVKFFDVSKPTLLKALQSGKVSGGKDEAGQWALDPSELARVYVARSAGARKTQKPEIPPVVSALPGEVAAELSDMRERLAAATLAAAVAQERAVAAERLAEERGRHIEDLRHMLPAPEARHGADRRGWWPFR